MKYWRIAAVLILILASVSTIACNQIAGSGDEPDGYLVKVVRGDLINSAAGTGKIVVSNDANLAFGTGGRIEGIFIDEGDEVNKGDLLAKLDTAALELALARAQEALILNSDAITQDSQGNPMVKVMVDEQIEERTVVIGISNGFETEIISRLSEGDMVVSQL